MRVLSLCLLTISLAVVHCSDITPAVFGSVLDGLPAAFGDFDSDELTDVFVIHNDKKTVEILLGADQEPLLRPGQNLSCTFDYPIVSVVPGDFDGDVFMDVLIILLVDRYNHMYNSYILWGGNGQLNCSDTLNLSIEMHGQPLAIDYNQDMIIDLFGMDKDNVRTFWVFNANRTIPMAIRMNVTDSHTSNRELPHIRSPHSNAFLDLNGDFMPDLFITTDKNFEIWHGNNEGFVYQSTIDLPYNLSYVEFSGQIGQSLYLDVELTGKMDLILPLCFDKLCTNSTIMIYTSDGWHNLPINFRDNENSLWGFIPGNGQPYTDTITLRGGDFNMDGYPDLLATLCSNQRKTSFLLLNVPCSICGTFNRTFEVRWNALNPFYNATVMATFYDFYQDGILDVILVGLDKNTEKYRMMAFKNSLDYDANFVKVMVLTGLTNSMYPISPGTLGRKKRTYGTNLPGPSIAYKTTTQNGNPRSAIAAQLPQSAHFSLNLPFTTFGLGRTPNFVDTLTIGVSGKSREWPQIIPNSQMVVIPNPIGEPSKWKAQLFVTPSKLILLSVAALTGTCGLISAIIMGLYWKERREDKIEKLQEAHRFHFDAM
ncbi:T-cell immunomodulatory protein [Cephus cinctus]|uniref:T-cell immunomodulatory protein n=1 Tax=Cephus cinctus TaxID=211228 RepID=A0AAJ7RFR0_CEPCN|nr:T-cell immunomodulatory protein [Cephus cinctus]XP_015592973.1 T-cell immunomodulatory protein [Cephus cinctus]XP_015592975.1 T-cell immunomodulatory protein [Cephus cinctus]XP_024939792.1 T-cell immunomodulatory protein [Cephus cinctus]XP_024939793.1 T-cell immunomodulatory protein [Cephus cinctus]XP_024939794.1 T-cell immunomodulatory protein [Cephus cinctus]